MTDAQIFNGIAEILTAGARKSREWVYNMDRQQEAEVLDAMALMARVIAEALT